MIRTYVQMYRIDVYISFLSFFSLSLNILQKKDNFKKSEKNNLFIRQIAFFLLLKGFYHRLMFFLNSLFQFLKEQKAEMKVAKCEICSLFQFLSLYSFQDKDRNNDMLMRIMEEESTTHF